MQTVTAQTQRQSGSEPSDSPHGPEMVSVTRELWQECLRRAQEAESLGRELEQMQALLDDANAKLAQETERLAQALQKLDQESAALQKMQATEQRHGLQPQARQPAQQPSEPLPIIGRMQAYANALRRHS